MTSNNLQAWYYRGTACVASPDVFGALDAAIEAVREAHGDRRHACESGCTACCSFPVGVGEREVRHLAAGLRDGLEPVRFDAVRAAVRLAAEVRATRTWRELADAREPCPLLDAAGRCVAYAARPLACRGCNSFRRAGCEANLAGAAYPPPEFDGATLALACGAHAALRAVGDGASYELVSALDRELTAPGASLALCKRAGGDD